ncbi:MAG: tRNA (guanosine(37)-N1)-methyltransferase TrmD [Planctomycetota bacterium]
MRIDLITLFPEMFASVLGSSILKRAASEVADPAEPAVVRPAVVSYHLHNPRDYTRDKHGKVDQPPYGGGPGMVLQCQPVYDCVIAAEAQQPELRATRLVMTPKGRPLTQTFVEELAGMPRLVVMAGRYEGFDQRLLDELEPVEVSLGDYVLTGGELPAMVLIDAVVRLIPGVIGKQDSHHHDSFSPGADRLLDHPHYTRPPQWRDRGVPEVLLSGDHGKIKAWRREQSRHLTHERRPDLLARDNANGSDNAGLIVLRDANATDYDSIDALLRTSFPTDAEAALVQSLRAAGDAPIEIIAEAAGRVVGMALLSPVTVDGGDGRFRGLGLAPVAVSEAYRGVGIGKALVRHAQRQARDAAAHGVVVLGEPGYYGPLGFETASKSGLGNTFGVDEPFMLHKIKDHPIAPGTVRFAPAFDALETEG